MNTLIYVLIYVLLYIVSYYSTRYIIKKQGEEWGWNEIRVTILLSLFIVTPIILVPILGVVHIIDYLNSFKSPPKWL